MSNFFRRSLSITRKGVGSYNSVTGLHQDGMPDTVSIKASIQPATVDDLKSLPEGRRTDGAYKLYSDDLIKVEDIFEINGDSYEVAMCEPWSNGVVNHYKAIAVKDHS